eukprot:UN3983
MHMQASFASSLRLDRRLSEARALLASACCSRRPVYRMRSRSGAASLADCRRTGCHKFVWLPSSTSGVGPQASGHSCISSLMHSLEDHEDGSVYAQGTGGCKRTPGGTALLRLLDQLFAKACSNVCNGPFGTRPREISRAKVLSSTSWRGHKATAISAAT